MVFIYIDASNLLPKMFSHHTLKATFQIHLSSHTKTVYFLNKAQTKIDDEMQIFLSSKLTIFPKA